jgi:hypothetical protein
MTDTLFISETKLKQFTDLNNNVDSVIIKNAIREAQDIQIQRLLGTKLYNRLIDGIKNEDLTDDETALLNNYVADAEVYWAYYYALDAVYLRPRNNGLIRPEGGENSIGVDLTFYDRKRNTIRKKAEWYSELLATYLFDNQSTFPLLNQNGKLYEKDPDYGSQYGRSPFVMRNTSRGQIQGYYRGLKMADGSRGGVPFGSPCEDC